MLAFPQGDFYTAKYCCDVHSYIIGTKTKENKKERKKHRAGRQKKIQHSAGSGGRGIYVQINNLFWVAG